MITITAELFKKAQKKDRGAVTEMFNMIFSALIRTDITSSLQGEGEEADVALMTLTKVFREIDSYRFEGPERFAGWVYKIHRNEAIGLFRKKTVRSSTRKKYLGFPNPQSQSPKDYETRDLFRVVWKFLNENEEEDTCQILLLSATGYTNEEIAERMKYKLPLVKTRLFRARKRAREFLNS